MYVSVTENRFWRIAPQKASILKLADCGWVFRETSRGERKGGS